MTRQCEYSKAAAIMVKILEIARLRSPERPTRPEVAVGLIPALLEEYLKLCGIAEFAPTEVGGPYLPDMKMMGLFFTVYNIYEEKRMVSHGPLMATIQSLEGTVAVQRVAEEIVEQSFDTREFRALRVGEPEEGVTEMAFITSGKTTGE